MNKPLLNNHYSQLGSDFYTFTRPVPVSKPHLIQFNQALADTLSLSSDDWDTELLAGNRIVSDSTPLAMVYAGHQFGHFSPQLGDGRAILLGDITSPEGIHFEIQLKGSGQTQYSRRGDGRSALGPVLREYLVSEAMAALGIPTTRALAVVTTGEHVAREQLVQGGILTRIARSFIRVGTFEYFASQQNIPALHALADYLIEHNYPQAKQAKQPYQSLLNRIIKSQAKLIAQWMQVGFIHGVMNTDNMSLAGETIDFGPCAFMDNYSHQKTFSSIDYAQRYAYNKQPSIALWNLTRLAEAWLPLLAKDTEQAVEEAKNALNQFQPLYESNWLSGMRQKIGLSQEQAEDNKLIDALLEQMNVQQADFTLTFTYLSQLSHQPTAIDKTLSDLFNHTDAFNQWLQQWRQRLAQENSQDNARQRMMQAVNPIYIPRNHQIEAAIRAAEDDNDFSVFYQLNEVLKNPYRVQSGKDKYQLAPLPNEEVTQTFCGT